MIFYINPFVPNAPFLYPLKTSENLTDVFRGVGKECIGSKWVKMILEITLQDIAQRAASINLATKSSQRHHIVMFVVEADLIQVIREH